MITKLKTIAVMTSGGDAPGMNAAIRAVVRTALVKGLEILAIHDGFEGLIEGRFEEMQAVSVSNIIHRGGTILKTSRSERFEHRSWREQAYKQLKNAGIEGVVIIGGNGSFAGAHVFTSEFDIPFIGVPKTIDNDVYGTDYAIGFDTAINTALEAMDKIKDTADAHHRLFFVEVMGRNRGFIALHTGIAAGAEAILIPESKTNINDLIALLDTGWKRHKSSMIVVVAEGAVDGGVTAIANEVKKCFDHYDIRVSVLGHMQRGGSPSCFDRVLAGKSSYEAVCALLNDKKNTIIGYQGNKLTYTSLKEAATLKHGIDDHLLSMAMVLAS